MTRPMPPRPRLPARPPAGILCALLLALLLSFSLFQYWKSSLSTLQQFYLLTYLKPRISVGNKPSFQTVALVFIGPRLATDASLTHAPGIATVRLMNVDRNTITAWMQRNVYDGSTPLQMLSMPGMAIGSCIVLCLIAGGMIDARNARIRRNGLKVKGPNLLSVRQYNRLAKGDGLSIQLAKKGQRLTLTRRQEAQNMFICGDIGTGKSSIIRQVLNYIEQCGETAVILDSQREFLPRYFNEERGDLVLNPKDERCPYWHIGREASDEADAIAVARSLFPQPSPDSTSKFFHGHTVGIFSYLLAYFHPAVNELGYWMAHPEEIDSRVKNTEHEHTLTANAPNQRAGILGTLNDAGMPLRMMPPSPKGRPQFTVRDWCKKREGWLFITNTQDTRDALRPIQSMWLDLILLRLMSMGKQPQLKRVWIILDELASLQTLPQLHTAITESRKTNHPLVIGIQNIADLDSLYNKKAKTIFSQALTKFVLATSEPESAKSLSQLVGEVEVLRVKETRSTGSNGRNSESVEEIRKPLVMPSEIQGLPDLEGYFLQRGKVVRVSLPYVERKETVPDLIDRIIPPMVQRPLITDDRESENPAGLNGENSFSLSSSDTKSEKKSQKRLNPLHPRSIQKTS